jgi:hypothetical protein
MVTIRTKYGQTARNAQTVNATSTGSHDVWNIDVELVRTRFHGSVICHR